MLRKILIGVLGAAVMGGFLTACDQSDKQESAAPAPPVEEAKPLNGQTEPQPAVGESLTSEQKKRFAQRLRVKTPIETLQVGQVVTIPVTVRNLGPEPWLAENSSSGEQAVNLWYHWIDWKPKTPKPEDESSAVTEKKHPQKLRVPLRTSRLQKRGKVIEFGGARTPLPHVVNPKEAVKLEATVKAPSRPGDFILRLTMMREGDGSFEDNGGRPLDLPVTVTQ